MTRCLIAWKVDTQLDKRSWSACNVSSLFPSTSFAFRRYYAPCLSIVSSLCKNAPPFSQLCAYEKLLKGCWSIVSSAACKFLYTTKLENLSFSWETVHTVINDNVNIRNGCNIVRLQIRRIRRDPTILDSRNILIF